MTLSQIISSVRGLLDDGQFDETIIIEAANWFQNELFNNTRTRGMETSAQITIDENSYLGDFPDDMQTLVSLYMSSPQKIDFSLWKVEYERFMATYPDFSIATPRRTNAWTDFGNQIRLSAPTNEQIILNCDYVRRPVPMTSLSDEMELDDAYSEIQVRGTLARCMERNEDYAEASQERSNMAPLITTFIRNEGRGQIQTGPQVINTRRRTRTIRTI